MKRASSIILRKPAFSPIFKNLNNMKPNKLPQSIGLLTAFFLFFSLLVSAQTYIKTLPAPPPDQTFYAWDAAALNDGNALIGTGKGQAWPFALEAIKLNQSGDMEGPAVNISSYTAYNNNLFPGTGNEGLYVGMWEGANFFRVKIKNDNTTEWLGLTPTPYTGKVYQSSTGDFYVINVLYMGTQVKLLKISSGGALLWQKTFNYSFPVGNSHLQNVTQTADGGVLVAFQAPPDSIAVLKLDGNGNQQWLKKIAAISSNGIGTLQIGNTYFVGASPRIFKFDLNGNKIGEIQTAGYIRWIGTADGNLLLGTYDDSAGFDLAMKKITQNGDLIWSKIYEKDNLYITPRALRLMPDGGFLYVGDGHDQSNPTQKAVLVVRTDSDGNVAGGSGCSPDVTPPVIVGCPSNISIFANQPTNMTWTPPTATDNCDTPTLTWTHAVGETFPFGTTTVTYTAKDAANNTATCAFTVTITPLGGNLPDLTLTNLSAPASGTAGSVVNFTYKLNNIGTATTGSNYIIGAYLSTDNTWSTNDVLAGTVPTGNTPVNYNTIVPASITIPAGTSAGNYFLICVADNVNVIQESNESNNTVSVAFEVTGGGGPVSYCNAYSSFPWEDWIAAVQIGTQVKTSGKSPYSDFSSTFNFNLAQGNNTVKLTGGFSYFGFEEYWRIWIDYNRDGDFDDFGELVSSTIMPKGPDGLPTQSVNTSFNVPIVTLPGVTRMRVIMKRGAFASPCENIAFGEIEDYSVNIAAQGACKKDIPGAILCHGEAPVAGQYYLYATNQGAQTRYTVNKDGEILGQTSMPVVLEDSTLVQNNTVVRKLANGSIAWQKAIPANVLSQFPTIEAAVELNDGTFILGGFQRQYNQGNVAADSLVFIKTDNNLNYQFYVRVSEFHNNLNFDKLKGFVKTSNGEVVAVFVTANTYFNTIYSYNFAKYTPQLQQIASGGIQLTELLSWQPTPCGYYSIRYKYSFPSIKSSSAGTTSMLYDFETMSIKTTKTSESGIVSYMGSYYRESYSSNLFGDTLTAHYQIVVSQQIISPFTISLKKADGTYFEKRPTLIDFNHIVQTGDTTVLFLGSNWALNPDCGSPGTKQPDISMANLTLQSTSTTPGAVVWFNFDLKNTGNTTATGEYIIAAYLSTDNQLSNNDLLTGYINTGNTPPGTIPSVLGGITVPAEQAVGSYYLILKADVTGVIFELNESNNVLATSAQINVSAGPDEVCGFETTVSKDGFAAYGAASINGHHVFKMNKYDATDNVSTFRNQTVGSDGLVTGTENFTLDEKVTPLSDENFLCATAGVPNIIYLKKINKSGTVLWVRQFQVYDALSLGEISIGEAINGDILLTGVFVAGSYPANFHKVFYIRADYNGNQIMRNDFTATTTDYPDLKARIFQGYNQNTYILVERPSPISSFTESLLLKVGWQFGDLKWTYDPGLTVEVKGVAEMPDGSTLVTSYFPGIYSGGVANQGYLAKIDANGGELFEKPLPQLAPAVPPGTAVSAVWGVGPIARGTDGGYITSFRRWMYIGQNAYEAVIIRLDSNLDTLWTRSFREPDDGLFRTFRAVPGGAFLGIRDVGDSQLKLMQIGADGQIAPCTAPADYCTSTSNFPWEDWISRVKLNTLDNTSGKSQYSNFTALSTTLQKGVDYQMTLTTSFSYFTWDEYWTVWVDLNHDGIFQNPAEAVLTKVLTAPANGTATASVSGTFKLPANALNGPTRMRVTMKRGGFATPCETLAFGEIEDYTVNIVDMLNGDDTDNRAANLSFEAVPEKTWVNLAGAYHFAEPVVQIEVEKSLDGNDYEVLETLQGKAIADNSQVVQVRDEQPKDGFNYYRMLVLFGNGDEVYSPVRVVSFDVPIDYTIFPNPATTEVFVQLTEAPEGEMQWNINDAFGRVIWSQKIAPDAPFPYRIDVTDFRDGLYYLFAMQPGRRAGGKRFVVVK